MTGGRKGIRGFLLDAPAPDRVRGIRDGALLIEDGRILDCGEFERIKLLPEAQGIVWQHGEGSVVLPGLIDLHAHLPQYPAVGRVESGLLPWLERHIFPLERNFNAAAARRLAPVFLEDLAKNGTTTAVLYAAVYEDSCHECFVAAERSGLRVILGKVMMDRSSYGSHPPETVLAASVEETRRLIGRWHGKAGGRLEYAVSPRFAVACSEEMLRAAGALAAEHGVYVQTHLAESRAEIDQVLGLFPGSRNYTGIYHDCGLTGPKTIFGHCIHLAAEEVDLLRDTGSVVAHCPTSNLFLRSGIMPLDRRLDAGLRVGLGSDVAAGPEPSLWRVMRCALESQVARSFYESCSIPGPSLLFYLATLGAAGALGKDHEIGSLEPGKAADLLVVDLASVRPGGRKRNLGADLSAEEILSLLVYCAGPHATAATYVAGIPVWIAPAPGLL